MFGRVQLASILNQHVSELKHSTCEMKHNLDVFSSGMLLCKSDLSQHSFVNRALHVSEVLHRK